MALTYAQLTTAIEQYLENTDATFVANIPVFVRQAEDRILKDLQMPRFRKSSTSPLAQGNRYLELPSDFLAPFALQAISGSTYYALDMKEPELITAMYPTTTSQGRPRVYGLWDHNTMIIGPALNAAYTMELHYFHRPESIVTASTTWLGDNAENALLFASLCEAYLYEKGEGDLLAAYEKRYADSISRLKNLGEGMARRDAARRGQFKREIT